MLERCVGLDPDFAPAWAALSLRYYYSGVVRVGPCRERGREHDHSRTLRARASRGREGALPRPQPRGGHAELHRLRDRGRQPRAGRPQGPGSRRPPPAGPAGALRARLRAALRGVARGGRPGMRRRPGGGPAQPRVPFLRVRLPAARKVRPRARLPAPRTPGRSGRRAREGEHPPARGQDRGGRRRSSRPRDLPVAAQLLRKAGTQAERTGSRRPGSRRDMPIRTPRTTTTSAASWPRPATPTRRCGCCERPSRTTTSPTRPWTTTRSSSRSARIAGVRRDPRRGDPPAEGVRRRARNGAAK